MLLAIWLFCIVVAREIHCDSTVCDTVGCDKVSEILSAHVNLTAQPCDDFFEFACGKVFEKEEYGGTFTDRMKEAEEAVVKIIESSNLYSKPAPIRSAKRFYERCLDMDPNEEDLKTEVANFVKNYAKWPLFKSNLGDLKIWELAAQLHGDLSIESFFEFEIQPTYSCEEMFVPKLRSSRQIFSHVHEHTGSRHDKWKDNKLNNLTFEDSDCISDLLTEHNEILENEDLSSNDTLNKICLFEHEMYSYFSLSHGHDIQSLDLDELDTIYKTKPIWKSYFRRIATSDLSAKLHNWLNDKPITVASPSFLEHLVETVESTPTKTVANFLLFKLIRFAKSFLMTSSAGKPFDPSDYDYSDELCERKTNQLANQTETQKSFAFQKCKCLEKTTELFPRIAGYLFIDPTNKTDVENKFAKNITKLIKESAEEMFRENGWLSEMAKVRVLKKLDSMIRTVGYDQSLLNLDVLTKLYENQTVKNSDNYFDIYKRFNAFSAADLNTKMDRNVMVIAEFEVNAVYVPSVNSIFLPFAILKSFGLKTDYPDFYNFGAMGVVIGHEMFHAFDDDGVHYDHVGERITGKDIYQMAKSSEIFTNLTKCFINDYSQHNYTNGVITLGIHIYLPFNTYPTPIIQLSVDGATTLGENLADFNGVTATYKAFQKAKRPETASIKHFHNYTDDQMFFISYASIWCSNQKKFDDRLTNAIRGDVHSPEDARVNVLLRNVPQFREAFRCQPDDKMYKNYLNGQCKFY